MGPIAVVTGGGRGIGRALVQALIHDGYRVVAVDVDEHSANATALQLGAVARRLDVRDGAAFSALIDELERDLGPVEVLVNNAGIMALGAFCDVDRVVDERQIDINVWGVYHGMRAVLPRMQDRRRGTIVNIASVAGKAGTPFAAMYSATKHAVVGLTEAVRYEVARDGVHLVVVCPALVDTELISGAGRPRWPPVARPEDVANAVVDAIRNKKPDVYVPRFARLSAILPVLLPRALYERIGSLLFADRMFAKVDAKARAAYAARTAR